MRQAWLIIAHNEFGLLQRLVTMLDADSSDFYVHIDSKVKQLPQLEVSKGRLFLPAERVDVRWGSVSQIEAELLLLQTASANGPYAHYHIISGTHLPLVSVEELTAFYDSHPGEEIVRMWADDPGDADFKLRRRHFPLRHFKYGTPLQRRLCQKTWTAVLRVQRILGLRQYRDCRFYKTDNWLSLSEKGCSYLVWRKKEILRKYRYSFCGDEYFVLSELMSRPDEFKIYDCKNLLHVEFMGDTPRTFRLQDYTELQKTGCLWARKFTGQ